VEAADTDPELIDALAELEHESSFVRVLGSYPAWREPPA
jgi:prephenate dehydratase